MRGGISFDTKKITTTAVMAALIFVVTWLVKVPVGIGHAYFNFGDVVIYMCAYLLGGPFAAIAAAVGSGLADAAGGAMIYVLPTIIIKGLMAFAAGTMTRKQDLKMYIFACVLGGGIMVAGYAVFEYFMFDTAYMVAALPFNLLQWGIGVAVAIALFGAARQMARYFDFRELRG